MFLRILVKIGFSIFSQWFSQFSNLAPLFIISPIKGAFKLQVTSAIKEWCALSSISFERSISGVKKVFNYWNFDRNIERLDLRIGMGWDGVKNWKQYIQLYFRCGNHKQIKILRTEKAFLPNTGKVFSGEVMAELIIILLITILSTIVFAFMLKQEWLVYSVGTIA